MKNVSSSFLLAERYSGFLAGCTRMVRESSDAAFPYSERHLQCIWFDSQLRPTALQSADGELVTVEDPGRWNLESGPDFLDCTLTIGPQNRKIRGDVEIHIRPRDWTDHDHSIEGEYSRVVAHVTFFPGTVAPHSLPRGAIQIAMQNPLRAIPSFSFDSIDLAAYPFSAPAPVPPCSAKMADWTPDDKGMLLDSAGHERLRRKSEQLASAIESTGKHQAFYSEILAALGYKNNRKPMRHLAALVPVDLLREVAYGDRIRAYAVLLGVSGLLPAEQSSRWDVATRQFIRTLWDHWWKLEARWDRRTMKRANWKLAGIRPPNHPLRRLAAAAGLFAAKQDLLATIEQASITRPAAWFKTMANLIEQGAHMDYWATRLALGGVADRSGVVLIGPGRTASILTNVVIPLLAATGSNVGKLLAAIPAEDDNAVVRQTAFWLFGRDHNPALYHNGIRQQGLLQIFHDFCLNNRSSCRTCALPQMLSSST